MEKSCTVINDEYSFKCGMCGGGTHITPIEESEYFSTFSLECRECSHKSYIFCMFLDSEDDLADLVEKYRMALRVKKEGEE